MTGGDSMNYKIGVNYWGSKYAIDMWKYWDEESVREDLKQLSQYGVRCMRVFPNWRDFQPVQRLRGHKGMNREYRFADDILPDNPFLIDMKQIEHFRTFCDIAKENNIELVVSLVTGWMSGRLFVPPAVEGQNHITSPESLVLQSKFVRGFVRMLKDRPEIIMWDLGNECNCMSPADNREQTYLWTSNIRNSILSEDTTRPISSGMHSLSIRDTWNLEDQGELCDYLTPHPYPSRSVGGHIDPMNMLRTSMVTTAQIVMYSGIGKKPAIIQETGTFNNMIGDQKTAADFSRVSLFSGWANGAKGYFWWCANDQMHIKTPPNCWSMNENELGILQAEYKPKEVALVLKEASNAIENMPFGELPNRVTDSVIVIPNNWSNREYVGLTCYTLAKQAGLDPVICHSEHTIPDSELYLVPSLMGWGPLTMNSLDALMQKVEKGATVYFSDGNGLLAGCEKHLGLASKGMVESNTIFTADFGDYKLPLKYGTKYLMYSVGAEVLAEDTDGTVLFSKFKYGKGTVYFLNSAFESDISTVPLAVNNQPYYKIYQTVAREVLAKKPVKSNHPDIAVTYHPINNKKFIAVAINYSEKTLPISIEFPENAEIKLCYGNEKDIAPCHTTVFEVSVK